jgi:hypothetical protein
MTALRGLWGWPLVLKVARWALQRGHEGYRRLSEHERHELQLLVRKSRGRPGRNLSRRERERLRVIVRKAWSREG